MGIIRLVAAALIVALNAWLASSAFEPIAAEHGPIEYLWISASFGRLAAYIAASIAALLLVQLGIVWRQPSGAGRHFLTDQNTRHLEPLGWMVMPLIPLANLFGPLAGRFAPVSYIFFDLRWYWWALAAILVLGRVNSALSFTQLQRAFIGRFAVAAVTIVPVASAIAFTPNLRFSAVLHGDEPKYLRYCENFYQGLGFDVSHQRLLADLPDQLPHAANNLRLLLRAVPQEIRLLANDAQRLLGGSAPPAPVPGERFASMVFEGKHPGTVYQLHNPGLAFILFPAYYVDRVATGSGVGYAGEFPAAMPAVHTTLLLLYAGYAVALYVLLFTYSGSRATAVILALVGAMSMPASAFAFQIYPEIAAGVAIFLLARAGIDLRPPGSLAHGTYGLLAGFLPWLHVRFGLATIVIALWVLTNDDRPRRSRLCFAAALAVALGALSLYTYRLTGSVVPTATFGPRVPISVSRLMFGLPAFMLDRTWGLLPHSPVYALAFAGIGLAWRRHRSDLIWILLLIASVVVPAASFGYAAGGSTPGRYLVSVAPLLLLFLSDALIVWRRRPMFLAVFAVVAFISVETTISYNLFHSKEVGPLVVREVSGWRFNLMFPSLGLEPATFSATHAALLGIWAVVASLLIWTSSRVPVTPEPASINSPSIGPKLRQVVGALFTGAAIATIIGAVNGEIFAIEYLIPPNEARNRVLAAFADVPRCAICYSSARGAIEPTDALGNVVDFIDLRTEPSSPRAGQPVRIRVRPRTPRGEYLVSLVRIDRGDGSTSSYPRNFGDVTETHLYAQAGEYEIRARVEASSGQPREARLRVRVVE